MGSSAFTGLGAGNSGLKRLIRQDNDFNPGDVLRLNGSTYTKASANSIDEAEVVGVVEDSTASSFTIVYSGEIDLSEMGSVVSGQAYFLQKTPAGSIDIQPPSATGTIKKTVLIGSNDNKGIVVNYLGLVNGIESDDLVNLEGIQPVGTIIPYAGPISQTSQIPEGWLLCDGSQFNSVTYPSLANLLQDTYGAIEGNLYKLPDLRARTPMGINLTNDATSKNAAFGTYNVGSEGGEEQHGLTDLEIPLHTHNISTDVFMDDVMTENNHPVYESIDGITYSSDGQGTTQKIDNQGPIIGDDWASLGDNDDGDYALIKYSNFVCGNHNNGAGQHHNNLQPYLTVNYLIRAKKEASAGILTVNLQDLADVDNTHNCGSSCIDGNCNIPRQGDSLIFNGSPSSFGELNVGHGSDKFVVTSVNSYDKNVIINGNFDIWQRNTSFSSEETNTSGRLWLADMWNFGKHSSTSSRHTISKITSGDADISKSPWDMGASMVPGNNFLQIYTTTPKSTMASQDYVHLNYFVEGNDMRPLWSAKCMSLSFFIRSKTVGTYSVAFRNWQFGRSYVATYNINQANTWEWKTITVPIPEWSDRSNWNFNDDTGLRITWTLAGGSDYATLSTNTWLSGNAIHSTNQVNGVGTVDTSSTASFQISQVQLESGSVSTPFQQMRLQDEIARCERYYEKSYELNTVPGTATSRGRINENDWVISPTAHISTTFRTRKMTTPTVTIYNPSNGDKNSYAMTHMESGSDTHHVVLSTYTSETNIYSITRDTTQTTLNSGYKNKITFQYVAVAPLS